MKAHWILIVSVIMAAFALNGCNPGASKTGNDNGPAFHDLNYEQAKEKARAENKIVMIDFGDSFG